MTRPRDGSVGPVAWLLRLDRAVAATCRWGVIACFAGLFVLLSIGILQRLTPLVRLSGYDELIELLFVWLTFLGAVALWREGALYRVAALDRAVGPRPLRALRFLTHAAMLAVAVLLTWQGLTFARMAGETTPFLQADKSWWYAAIPACGALMTIYSLAALWRTLRGHPPADDGSGALLG